MSLTGPFKDITEVRVLAVCCPRRHALPFLVKRTVAVSLCTAAQVCGKSFGPSGYAAGMPLCLCQC